jgi:hypothetical protein
MITYGITHERSCGRTHSSKNIRNFFLGNKKKDVEVSTCFFWGRACGPSKKGKKKKIKEIFGFL